MSFFSPTPSTATENHMDNYFVFVFTPPRNFTEELTMAMDGEFGDPPWLFEKAIHVIYMDTNSVRNLL